MSRKSVLIIGSDSLWEEEQLLQEAVAAGWEASFLLAQSLTIILDEQGADILKDGERLGARFRESRIIFRRARRAPHIMTALALLARQWGVPATDAPLSILTNIDKCISMPSIPLHVIRHIPGCFLSEQASVDLPAAGLSLPLLAKPAQGRHGEGVEIFHAEEDILSFFARRKGDYIVQRYLPLQAEYRVLVVGGEALGVIHKIPAEGSAVANYAAGAQFVPDTLPASVTAECVEICRSQQIDIGGVDIAYADGAHYLLEVNRCPEFRAFQTATGVPVARAIVQLLSYR